MSSAGKNLAPLGVLFYFPSILLILLYQKARAYIRLSSYFDTFVKLSCLPSFLSPNIGHFPNIVRDYLFSDPLSFSKTFTLSKLLQRENCTRKRLALLPLLWQSKLVETSYPTCVLYLVLCSFLLFVLCSFSFFSMVRPRFVLI